MKTYKVTSSRKIFGYSRGTTFQRDISQEQEDRLIRRKQIEVVSGAETDAQSERGKTTSTEVPDTNETSAPDKGDKNRPNNDLGKTAERR